MKTQFLYLLIGVFVSLVSSCDEIDNLSGGASAPEVTYGSTTYEAEFYKAGNSTTPSIDWNGAQGSVSLGSNIDGLSVNSTTGQLQWTKLLPPGTHDVEVVLSNSEGQVVVPVVIDNPLRGHFTGLYRNAYDFTIIFDGAGNLDIAATATDGTVYTGSGTLESLVDGTLKATYKYDDFPDTPLKVEGDLSQTQSAAVLTGKFFSSSASENYQVTLE